MAHERLKGRVQRLLDAKAKVEARLGGELPARKRRQLEDKLQEFNTSLRNLQKHGQETPPTGNKVSVNIDVPKGKFTVTEHAPERS